MGVRVSVCECVYLHVARLSQSFRFRLPLFIYDNICRDNLRLSIYACVCVCMWKFVWVCVCWGVNIPATHTSLIILTA